MCPGKYEKHQFHYNLYLKKNIANTQSNFISNIYEVNSVSFLLGSLRDKKINKIINTL